MTTWFEVKVKYVKIDESTGKEKKVTSPFLFDAMSWIEAESRAWKELPEFITGEFTIEGIKKTKIIELFPYDDGGYWFRSITTMFKVDEERGGECEFRCEYMIQADDIQMSLFRISEQLKTTTVPYTINSIGVTDVLEIFPIGEFGELERIAIKEISK